MRDKMIMEDAKWNKLVVVKADGVQVLEFDVVVVDVTLGWRNFSSGVKLHAKGKQNTIKKAPVSY